MFENIPDYQYGKDNLSRIIVMHRSGLIAIILTNRDLFESSDKQ